MAKFRSKWRAEQLPVYFLSPNGEDCVFGLFAIFKVFGLDAAAASADGGTILDSGQAPSPHAQGWNKPQGETPRSDHKPSQADRSFGVDFPLDFPGFSQDLPGFSLGPLFGPGPWARGWTWAPFLGRALGPKI